MVVVAGGTFTPTSWRDRQSFEMQSAVVFACNQMVCQRCSGARTADIGTNSMTAEGLFRLVQGCVMCVK